MKVTAAIARSHGALLRLEPLELAEPDGDEVLVRIVACGVAAADLAGIDGRLATPLPFVPGTEGAGIVERVGADVSTLVPGDAVVLVFDHCGTCESCRAGRPRACAAFASCNLEGHGIGKPLPFSDGEHDVAGHFYGQSAFATHALCREACAIKLAKDSPLELLACLGGEFLLGAGAIVEAFRMEAGGSIAVMGAGAIGLAATMVAKARGAKMIIVADADERRRTLASELGADAAFHLDENVADLVRSLVADGVTFAVETTGEPVARHACFASMAPGATCAVVGKTDEATVPVPAGAYVVPLDHYAQPGLLVPILAAMHADGSLPLEQLIDFFPFEHVNDALEALRMGEIVKPVLRFSIGGFGSLDRALVEGTERDLPDPQPAKDVTETTKPDLVKS